MDYYDRIVKAKKLIDDFVLKGKFSKEDIIFFVSRSTGLGERFINKYINECVLRDIFILSKDGILSYKIWSDDKTEVKE